jgi:hypothetical protein
MPTIAFIASGGNLERALSTGGCDDTSDANDLGAFAKFELSVGAQVKSLIRGPQTHTTQPRRPWRERCSFDVNLASVINVVRRKSDDASIARHQGLEPAAARRG